MYKKVHYGNITLITSKTQSRPELSKNRSSFSSSLFSNFDISMTYLVTIVNPELTPSGRKNNHQN